MLAEILGGTSTSRLYRSLVIEQKLATSAGAYYRGTALDLTTFRLYGSPRPGVSLDQLEAAFDAELARLESEPITAEEVQRATRRMVAEAIYARDSLSSAVRSFGAALATGRTVDDVEAWPERIGAVTVEQVNAAAAYVFKARALGHRAAHSGSRGYGRGRAGRGSARAAGRRSGNRCRRAGQRWLRAPFGPVSSACRSRLAW